ncbi:MAG: insulinase family protein [Opitutae bacterium]|nr:insulinase family protein [Opitutae bacterium]
MKRFTLLFSVLCLLSSGLLAQIAPKVTRTRIAGLDVLLYPTGVKNVVNLKGSLPAGDVFATANPAVATLTGMLLDQGTTRQDKFAIAARLDAVGATLDFSVGNELVEFSAKCLKKDVPLVLSLLAEQLRSPALSAEEFDKAKKQFAGTLQRALESTDNQAAEAAALALYPAGHPNRPTPHAELLAAIERATLAEVKAFHQAHYGPAHLTITAVGDLDLPQIQAELAKGFAGWTGGVALPATLPASPGDAPKEQTVFMAEKTSVSVIFAQPSRLRYGQSDYQALRLGTAILGSGFTGRLMGNVRDKEGLTYGIGARLANDTFADGDFRIAGTFAPNLLDQGIASTLRQLNLWHEQGVTDKEVADRKTNLIGSFKVNLATTDGMANQLLATVNRGLPLSWLDTYATEIAALTPAQVNGAIKQHLDPAKMVLIKAGTVPGATAK